MSTSEHPGVRGFFTKTKPGRMLLFTAFLALLSFLVPYGCAKKSAERGGAGPNARADLPSAQDLPPSPAGIGDTITLGEKYNALISRWGGDLSTAKSDLDQTKKELDTLRAQIKDERALQVKEKQDLEGTLRKLRDGILQAAGAPERRESPPPGARDSGGGSQALQASGPGGVLRLLELSPAREKEKPKDRKAVRIPTASGGRATLLNGVFAPVSGEPSPVRLRFDAAILGPNKAWIPIKDSYLIGKASGDPNACRVSIQIEKFSTVKMKGEAIETKALGYVVGEDGLEGVPGSYEWRAWEYLPLALGSGALQGMSGALAQTQATTSVNPLGGASTVVTGDAVRFAGFQAASGASGKLGEIVTERMKEIRPAVSTPADRKVTVVFLEGVSLEGLDVQEIDYGREQDPFRGLDSHR